MFVKMLNGTVGVVIQLLEHVLDVHLHTYTIVQISEPENKIMIVISELNVSNDAWLWTVLFLVEGDDTPPPPNRAPMDIDRFEGGRGEGGDSLVVMEKSRLVGVDVFSKLFTFFTRCESEELRFARPRLIAKAFNLALLVLLIDFFPHRSRILALMYSYRESFPAVPVIEREARVELVINECACECVFD